MESDTIFALALDSCTELLETAHEKDMAKLRDAVKDQDYDILKHQSWIEPAQQVAGSFASNGHAASYEQQGNVGSDFATKGPMQNKHFAANKKKMAQKPVTAKDFFGVKKNSNSNSSKKSAKNTEGDDDDEESPKDSKKKTPSTTSFKSKATKSKQSTEKENSANSRGKKKPDANKQKDDDVDDDDDDDAVPTKGFVGNADDFVGDEDEDSEDEREHEEHLKKARQQAREQEAQEAVSSSKSSKRNRKTQAQVEEEMRREEAARKASGMNNEGGDDDDDGTPHFKGAMDAFTTKKKPVAVTATSTLAPGKKRRKRFVEKTTKDANGYLKTTTEVVWEDVDASEIDDEKEEETWTGKKEGTAAAAANQKPVSNKPSLPKKKAPANTADLKQKGIMGFFAKKN